MGPQRAAKCRLCFAAMNDQDIADMTVAKVLNDKEAIVSFEIEEAKGEQEQKQSGGWISASGHIVTAVVGAGVLGLPHAMGWLGMPAGIALLCIFYAITMWTSWLLAEVHEVNGVRYGRYRDLVLKVLGRADYLALFICQYANLILLTIGYAVTAGESISTIVILTASKCPSEITDDIDKRADCEHHIPVWACIFMFGGTQIFFSQIRDLESAWWTSALGAIASLMYSLLAFGLSVAKADGDRASATGIETKTKEQKMWGVLAALGTIAFAYNYSNVLLEIQSTLADSPKKSQHPMKKAVFTGITTAVSLYMGVAIAGYLALGNDVPAEILTGFNGPEWVVVLANIAVLVHMFGAYQVFGQPIFELIEEHLCSKLACAAAMRPWILRLVVRTIYVLIATTIAAAMPFFGVFVSLIGSLTFWLPAVHMPFRLHSTIFPPKLWKKILMIVVDVFIFFVCALAIISSFRNLVLTLKHATFFSD